MILAPCKKIYKNETQRTTSPEDTLARVEKALPAAGITRVADITSLDRVGIPVFSSIRPTAGRGAVSVYNGKGATPTEARVSAIMEGIERYSAEVPPGSSLITESYSKINREYPCLDPDLLILPARSDPVMPIPWVRGFDLVGNEVLMVPASAVFHPLPEEYPQLFRTSTNGLASGNTLEEAVFHALMEVIERDAWSLVEARRNTGPRVGAVSEPLSLDLLSRFSSAEVEVVVKDITSDLKIPTFAAVSDDTRLRDPALLTIGMGTHTNAAIALLRALTEVAQSRLTQIHGAREDTPTADIRKKIGYERVRRMNKYWFDAESEIPFSSVTSCDTDDFLTDITMTIARLKSAGMDRVIVVDLTRPELGVPVVRVIVPGLESFAMDQERMGARCRAARDRRISGSKL
ncbi:MAG: YcaO-like family protein [Methanoregulaceae archaeon PtaB.Bin152]|nr:MAG: YcaO-like family protein [Methanoregulaceae archaeon PtaB.Bin152]OPY48532.1 MAG: YcaO-like family protein [Methanoregulaceae archaeon PtaU1.Bin222]